MDIKSFFRTIQWRATLQVAAIRIAIASILWSLFLVTVGNAKFSEFFPQIFTFLLLFSALVAIAIPAIGLARANIPYIGLAALPAWAIVVADPLVKVLHAKRPDLVPVDNFKYFNPPVLAIFGVEDSTQSVDPAAHVRSRVKTDIASAERRPTQVDVALDEFVRSATGHDVTRALDLWRTSSKQIVEKYRRARDDEDGSAWREGNFALFDTLIWHGVKAGDADATRTVEALISAGVLLSEPDRAGWTPVGLLAMIGNLQLLQHAIQSGGDVNAGDENALACVFGNRELDDGWTKAADLLVKAGVHVNGSPGQTPPVFAALSRNHREAIRFLVANGADLNGVHYVKRADFSGTAMHYSVLAAFADETDLETGKLLVALGGDPTVKNKEGLGAIDAFFASDREPTDNVKALVKLYSATDIWRQSSLYLSNPDPSDYNPVRGRTLSDQNQEKLWNEIAGTEVRFRIGDKVEVIRRGGFYGNRVNLTLLEGGSEQVCDGKMIALAGATGIITGWDQNHGNHWKAIIDFEPGTWEEADNYGRTRSLGKCRGSMFPEALKILQTEEETNKGIRV